MPLIFSSAASTFSGKSKNSFAALSEAAYASEDGDTSHLLDIMQAAENGFMEVFTLRNINSCDGHLHSILPIINPIQAPDRHSTTLSITFSNALNKSPCSIRNSVSMENVENVVKAPSRPTSIAPLNSGLTYSRSINKIVNRPISTEPMTLTMRVP